MPVADRVAGTTYRGRRSSSSTARYAAPEVMVKVLSRGGRNLKAVGRHSAYLNRGGEVEIETDDGQQLSGNGVEKGLLEDWELDLEEHRHTANLESRSRRIPPKLVHKVLFSMPPGTLACLHIATRGWRSTSRRRLTLHY